MARLHAREKLQVAVRHFMELRAAKDSSKDPEISAALRRIAGSFADTHR